MRILYFGTYTKEWGRTSIYMKGLKALGCEVLECQDTSLGLLKYWRLLRKHSKLRNSYDLMIAGYPSHAVVWFARLISKRPVIFDALCTMEEGVLISRGQRGLKSIYIKLLDWLAVKSAHIVLVESEAQRKYFEGKFGKSDKYKVVYTGADDKIFYPDENVHKRAKFTALFRGKFLPEAGVRHILEAAKILEDQDVYFLVIGNGWLESEIKSQISDLKLKNLELVTGNLPQDKLREMMLGCHVSLGQLEDHERLKRTIPHKCFETLALGMPYITARYEPVMEILEDGKSVLFVKPGDAKELAQKILELKNSSDLAKSIGKAGHDIYIERFNPTVLARKIMELLPNK